MLNRISIIEIVEHMPETFSIDDLLEKIIIQQKVENARTEIENGESIDWEDLKKDMELW